MNIERFKTILLLAVLMLFMVPQSAWATYRAVATNSKLPGAFSVGATKQVWFSQGNLQYQADNGDGGSTWRFAINQYDFVGDATHGNVYLGETKCDNANISSTYTDWIDLFGWATSGNSASGTAYQPWSISTTNSYYGPAISSGEWTAANSDWGVVNVAQLGSGWRTLTHDEWVYLINTRTNASSLRTFATVNGVVELILMPDGWTTSGVSLTITTANYTSNATTKSITATPSASAASGWYLIASPFVSVTPSTENGFLTNNYDLFRFNQSAEMEWQNYQIHHNATENPFNALVTRSA